MANYNDHPITKKEFMDWLGRLFDWIANYEAVLSGIAATIAIVAVVFALSSRTFGLFRSQAEKTDSPADSDRKLGDKEIRQHIRYCRLPNGRNIAWSSAGDGYPLVRSLGWFTNLEVEWNSPVASPFWKKLANRYHLIRYDGRGMGLSDRDVEEFSPQTRLEDLETVIEASGVEKCALMGMSEGGSTAIEYAAKYPDRVSHLIIWGSFLVVPSSEEIPQFFAIARLVPQYWGSESSAFHQMFTATFLPDGNAAQNMLFNEMQRTSATPETAFAFMKSIADVDVREIASEVKTPALVMHRKGDLAIPVKHGQRMAAQLPNARMVLLDGSNHWMITDEADMDHIVALIDDFVLKSGDKS